MTVCANGLNYSFQNYLPQKVEIIANERFNEDEAEIHSFNSLPTNKTVIVRR